MLKSIKFLLPIAAVLFVGLVFTGCTDENANDEVKEETKKTDQVVTHTPETLQKEIRDLEAAVGNLDTPNHDAVTVQLIEFYESYANLFSTDELAPDMLFRAGNQAVNLEDYPKALALYARVEKHYRQYQKRPECIFLQGFVYETYMNEFGKAKEKYEKLIKVYPEHALAIQAEESIKYLGMSDTDRIKQFQKK